MKRAGSRVNIRIKAQLWMEFWWMLELDGTVRGYVNNQLLNCHQMRWVAGRQAQSGQLPLCSAGCGIRLPASRTVELVSGEIAMT